MKRRKLDPVTRYKVMSSIKGKDTKPEILLRKTLWTIGVRGWRCHAKDTPGKPDLLFRKPRLAVFVDGVWWHGHPDYYWPGIRNKYWDEKIQGNIKRDKRINLLLNKLGWKVLRFWDKDILQNSLKCAKLVQSILLERSKIS